MRAVRAGCLALALLALAVLAPAGPAAVADRDVFFGDAFRLEVADPGPFARLADGRLACLSEACAGHTVRLGESTIVVRPRVTAEQVAARRAPYKAPTGAGAAGGTPAAAVLALAAAAVLALLALALALAAAALLPRRQRVPEPRLGRALRLVRESAAREPADRRRALDHLADVVQGSPWEARATRLAWARPLPASEAAQALADEVDR